MTLTYRNGVSIAEIIVYVPALLIATFLAVRHGLGRNAGWLFLILFCLARIIGPIMQLLTINNPTNTGLYTGYAILQNIGLSPLMLAAIGLLSRLLSSINKSKTILVRSGMFHLIHLVIIIGLILGIVGGINASNAYVSSHYQSYAPGSLNKAGTALFIVAYVAILALTAVIGLNISAAEKGEKRLFMAVAISLPFLLVRLIYSILFTFTHNNDFNLLTGSVTVVLCVALIEEFIIVVIYEGTGLTLKKVEKHFEATHQIPSYDSATPLQNQYAGAGQVPRQQPKKENIFLKIAKYTIIGHLIRALMPKKDQDVEMQQQK
jgi:MFS family permease